MGGRYNGRHNNRIGIHSRHSRPAGHRRIDRQVGLNCSECPKARPYQGDTISDKQFLVCTHDDCIVTDEDNSESVIECPYKDNP